VVSLGIECAMCPTGTARFEGDDLALFKDHKTVNVKHQGIDRSGVTTRSDHERQ